eukprot:6194003-Pleurochrysis_carterae.AAC.4
MAAAGSLRYSWWGKLLLRAMGAGSGTLFLNGRRRVAPHVGARNQACMHAHMIATTCDRSGVFPVA